MAAVGTATQVLERGLTAQDAVVSLIESIGEDPSRDGLLDTPRRVVKALGEMTAGYAMDPADILRTTFAETHDQMIVLRGIRFVSLCEHHLLPFTGTVTIGYIPNGRVVGVSKLVRLVECFARRLQIQERMTDQIAKALMEHVGVIGAGVIVRAHHSCMGCRGVRQPDAEMITSAMLGAMRDNASARAELMGLHCG